jgi:hypothetical protein
LWLTGYAPVLQDEGRIFDDDFSGYPRDEYERDLNELGRLCGTVRKAMKKKRSA